ncbi:MAG: dTDP-glucose 4,6-dehydratase [Acidobacteriota bacterium]
MKDLYIVTGGAGFIGSNFVRHCLAQSGAQVVVLDKLTYAGNLESLRECESDPRFRFVRGDIADRDLVRRLITEGRPSAILNFAAETHVDRSIDGPEAFVNTNVVGTFVLLDEARAYWKALSGEAKARFRFLQVSTDEVYGSLGSEGAFSETTPVNPNSPYSASKASADHFAHAFCQTYGLPTLLTNCSNNYGPYQFPEKLIPLMILNALEGRSLPIYGDGGNVRDWLFVEDHCSGILEVLRRGRSGERYNLGGKCERRNVEIVDLLCRILEELRPARENAFLRRAGARAYGDLKTFVPDRPGHDRRYAIDTGKVEKELGWQPSHTLETGLRKTVSWYLDHADWCEAVQSRGYRRERLGLRQPTGSE